MEKSKIPLSLRIPRKRQRDIAALQDVVVETLSKTFPECVLHGGTAIWRCYGGNRFSEDVDVYIRKNMDMIEKFFSEMKRIGFNIPKKRVKENSIYSKLVFNETEIRFEAVFRKVNGVVREYETVNGVFMNVITLSPEELIREKADAYLKRRKIRDVYDIYFLMSRVADPDKVKSSLKKLISNFSSPIDEGDLKTIILIGAVPTTSQIMENIKRWAG